jgi:hypothetical protein
MGPTLARRKRANIGQMLLAAAPTAGSTIRQRLINSAGFDKATLSRVAKKSPQLQNSKKPGQTVGLSIPENRIDVRAASAQACG